MEIAIVTYQYPPTGKGGIASIAYNLYHGLKKKHNVELICNKDHKEGNKIFYDFKKMKGATFKNVLFMLFIEKIKLDWVIAIEEACSYPVYILVKKSGAKLAMLSHGTSLMRKPHQPIKRRLFNFILKRTDLFIANSESTMRLLDNKIFSKPKNKCIINPGIDFKKFNQKKSMKKKLGLSRKRIIFSAAGLVPVRKQEELFEIMPDLIKKFPNLVYVIAGDGPKRQLMEEIVAYKDLQDHVIFLGNISKNLEQYYQMADVYVMLGQDTFGISFLEASASEKPVLTIGKKETILNKKTGYTCRDLNDLYKKISYLLENPKKAKMMGKAGKKFARQFDWKNIVEKYEEEMASGVYISIDN